MPLFVRKFVVDFVETGVAALFALNFILPVNVSDVFHIGLAVAAALAGAAVAAARRAAPAAFAYLRERLGVSESE